MAQNDFTIDNQAFPATRSDINSALQALASLSSGASSPSITFAYQLWVNTTSDPNILNIRNSANNSWIKIGEVNQASAAFILSAYAYLQAGSAAAPSFSFDVDRDVGMYRAAANIIGFATNGTERFRVGDSGQLGIGGATYGTTGQVLTSGGASAAPSWASVTSGAYSLISTATANASSSIIFTGLSSYVALRLLAYNVLGSNSVSKSQIQLSSDNGSTYITTSTYYNESNWATSATATGYAQNTDNQFQITNGSASGSSFEFIITNLNIAKPTGIMTQANASNGRKNQMGFQTESTAMNAFKIFQNTGTITSGTFILEGIVG